MIFTSTTAPFRTTPSALFRENGDLNGFPGKCVDSHVFAIATTFNADWSAYKPILPFVPMANAINKPAECKYATLFKIDIKIPLDLPQIKGTIFAVEDFRRVKDTGTVSYRFAVRGGCAGASYHVTSEYADEFAKALARYAPANAKGKKRALENVEDMSDKRLIEAGERANKRLKTTNEDADFWADLEVGPAEVDFDRMNE